MKQKTRPSILTWEIKGLIWFLICIRRPRPRSTMVGKLSSRSVWPVGAVSKTTTEKFIPFTNLRWEEKTLQIGSGNDSNYYCTRIHHLTSWPRHSSWPHRCPGRRSLPPASSSSPYWACCPPQKIHRGALPHQGWGRSPALKRPHDPTITQIKAFDHWLLVGQPQHFKKDQDHLYFCWSCYFSRVPPTIAKRLS